jgi:hypothetical protein
MRTTRDIVRSQLRLIIVNVIYLGNFHFVEELQLIHILPDLFSNGATQLGNQGNLVLFCVTLQ